MKDPVRAPSSNPSEELATKQCVYRAGVAAVFLDRDGTLNVKPPEGDYLQSVADFQWLPGAVKGVAILGHAGFALFVVSNQRGVARGLVSEATLAASERMIQHALEPLNAGIKAFRYCRHDLADRCTCRKPAPGMILDLAREHRLDLQRSWMIGDALSDIAAGKAAGCRTARIGEPVKSLGEGPAPDVVAPTLLLASKEIISRSSSVAAAGPSTTGRVPRRGRLPREPRRGALENRGPARPWGQQAPTEEAQDRTIGSVLW